MSQMAPVFQWRHTVVARLNSWGGRTIIVQQQRRNRTGRMKCLKVHHCSLKLFVSQSELYFLYGEILLPHTNTHSHTQHFGLWASPFQRYKIKVVLMDAEKMACWRGGSWKAATCFVFHQSALNQRAPSVLKCWDADTKGRRDGMKEERKTGGKKKRGEDLSVRSRLIKAFLWTWTGSTWMHIQWAIAYIALKHRILLFILKQGLWLAHKGCWLPAIYQREQKNTPVGLVPLFPLSLCEYQQMIKAAKHNSDQQSHTINHKYLSSTYLSWLWVGKYFCSSFCTLLHLLFSSFFGCSWLFL